MTEDEPEEPAALAIRHADLPAALESLVDAAHAYVRKSHADRTHAAYAAQWKHFVAWCTQHDLAPLPARPETLVLYLTARAQEGRKVATLAQAMAAIGRAHALAGHPSPSTYRIVKDAFAGIRRVHGSAQVQKLPLLVPDLQRIVHALPATVAGDRDRALLLVGFAGAFRRSELVALEFRDARFVHDGLRLFLRRSKTDQKGVGRPVAVPFGRDEEVCPVRALATWMRRASIIEGPIFRGVDRHGHVGGPLRGPDVACIVKRRVQAVGLDPSDYAGHSLRAGLCTSAAKAGKSAHTIMKTTGHVTVAMVHRYIRDAELFSDNAASDLL